MVVEYSNKKYRISSKAEEKSGADGFKLNTQINAEYIIQNVVSSDKNVLIFEDGRKSYFAEDEKHYFVFIDGHTFTFNKKDENFDYFEDSTDNSNQNIIKSPMPGSIVNVLVNEGQKVEEGTPIIIVSAMKMETTLYSSISGIVVEVNAIKGEQVDETKSLVVITKEEN